MNVYTRKRSIPIASTLVGLLLIIASCSTQKNTASTRWWQAFNARYNTYFNGAQAYIDGSLEKENGNKDNYTELLPLYTVANKGSREIGKSHFERAIEKSKKAIQRHSIKRKPEWNKTRKKTEKDIEWLNRREYNPFLWKAWMLMGRSQFHKGDFDEAASTFSYMSRLYEGQPAIYGKARAWLAKCYIEQDWMYDAEDVIRNYLRDSVNWRAQKEWNLTLTDYYLHTGDYAQAATYLQRVIKQEMRKKQKAREYFLLGQLYTRLQKREDAYRAYRRVIRQNPPYELEFNARIAMTEVMSHHNEKQMIARLKRMAANDNNKDYLDQVYYAIGNIHLNQQDTANAISAYEKGVEKGTRSGAEKGTLLLRLGNLYWQRQQFSDARRCYNAAIGMLDRDHNEYEQLSQRSIVLDQLVPYTEAIHLQDSLQALANMSEEERNAAIDRVIEDLKKKEREQKRQQQEAEAEQIQQQNAGTGLDIPGRNITPTTQQQDAVWYFYNPLAVAQGKTAFQQQWGKRENIDDWQRVNRTVVGNFDAPEDDLTPQQQDSIRQQQAIQDSISNAKDSVQNDPHRREYYLKQIPFTPEKKAESDIIIMQSLHQAGVILKDKLNNLYLSKNHLQRLKEQYGDQYENMDDVYYHMFLLYSRLDRHEEAQAYILLLRQKYPESKWTALLTDPYYQRNAIFGAQIEDSLYTATYIAFKENRYQEVLTNARMAKEQFPMGANRDKFLFLSGMTQLNKGNTEACKADLNNVVADYGGSRISELAGMILNGINAGRRVYGGQFALENMWNMRTEILQESSDSTQQRTLTAERNTPFAFLLMYNADSVSENKLLFEMAKYNFTNYMVRNFDIVIEQYADLSRMRFNGFRSFDEAHLYANQLHANHELRPLLEKTTPLIISEANLQLLGNTFTMEEYGDFYSKHFAPIKVTNLYLLTEPAELGDEKSMEDIVPNLPDDEEEEDEAATQDEQTTVMEEENTLVEEPENTIEELEYSPTPEESATIEEENTTIIEENIAPLEENIVTEETIEEEEREQEEPVFIEQEAPVSQPATPQQPAPQPQENTAVENPEAITPSTTLPPQPQEPAKKEVEEENEFEVIFTEDILPASAAPNTKQPTAPPPPIEEEEDEYYELEGV